MNFVDNFDRFTQDYFLDKESQKRYMRLVFHLFKCAVTNAFKMHK